MSKKDFSELLIPTSSGKATKYNHYKPFQDPDRRASQVTFSNSTDLNKAMFASLQADQQPKTATNTNRTQSEHKVDTKWTQTEHKVNTKTTKSKKSEHKVNTELNTKLDTNRTQSEHKVNTKTSFSTLVGLQRDIMIFIYNECKTARSKTTKNLSVEHISSTLKMPRGSIKTTIKRIEQKGLIERTSFKTGRGGWASYSVPDFLFQELLQYETEHKLNTKWTQSEHKVNTELNTELNTSPPVVSSYINTNYRDLDIPDSWKDIELTSLEMVGFNFSHLVQIHRAYEKAPNIALPPELIQSSIDAFAYDYKNNNIEKSFKKPAATVLLSLLKKGQPYNSITPDKCISPLQEALNKHNQMLLLQRTQEQQMLQQLQETEFELWRDKLTDEQLLDFCPESELASGIPVNLRKTYRLRKAKELTKDYFEAEIWPAKKQKLLAAMTKRSIQEEITQS